MPSGTLPWETLFDSLVVPALVLDPDFTILSANRAALKFSGYRCDEIIHHKCYQAFHGRPDGPPDGCPMKQLLEGELAGTVEMEVEACHGCCLVSCTPVLADDGALQAVLHVSMDISQRRQAELELQAYREQLEEMVAQRTRLLEEANQELEAFCYSVSHDLRAPLRHVHGFLAMLSEEYGPLLGAGGKRYVDRASRSVLHMGELIDDLLRLSRYSRAPITPRTINLEEMVRSVAAQLGDTMEQVQLQIEPDITINGDPVLLRVVLTNLLDNACKYSAPVPSPAIKVGMVEHEDGTVYYVQDNGVGFDMAHMHKLFSPFERLHQQDDFPGNGVGLASVQRIINRHGGSIWAEGRPGEGATFYFTVG